VDGGETKVLVVEDDAATAEFLLDNLRADGYRAASASGVGEGLRAIEVRQPDLLLLDLMLEDGHGLELLDHVRSADGLASRLDPDLPVIVLSGRGGETDRVRGFARGCDDYVGKPFSYPELHARIRAVLRRAAERSRRGVLRVGGLVLDPITRRVQLDGKPIHLSAKEFSLLQALAGDPTAVFPKEQLLRDVWGYVAMGNTRTLDAHACRLRKKLGGSARPFVLNLRGVGYRLTEAV
jgi:DNA-binding response OmpR family regulator